VFRVKATLVSAPGVLVEHVSKTQIVKKRRRSKTKEDLPVSGGPNLTSDPDVFSQISTQDATELQ